MAKNILVINVDIRETRVALIENGIIAELHMEREGARGTLGNIYLGKVSRVLPGMQAAFIDVGQERAAFLHVEDLIRPDDFEAYLAGHRHGKSSSEESRTESGADEGGDDEAEGEPDSDAEAAASGEPEVASAHVGGGDVVEADEGDEPRSDEDAPLTADADAEEDEDLEVDRDEAEGEHADDDADAAEASDDGSESDALDADDPDDVDVDVGADADEVFAEATSDDADEDGGEHDDEVMETKLAATSTTGDDADGESDDDESDDDESIDAATAEDAGENAAPGVEPSATAGATPTAEDEAGLKAPRARTRRGGRGRRRRGKTRPEGADAPAEAAVAAVAPRPERGQEQRGRSGGRSQDPRNAQGPRGGGGPQQGRGAQRDRGRGRPASAPAGRGDGDRHGRSKDARRSDGRRGQSQGRGAAARAKDPLRVSKSTPIREVVREGQEVVVQVSKEPIGTKGARVTSHISLPGRYVVYLPTVEHIGISKRIGSDKERGRLREAIEAMKPPQGGLIVRTLAEGLTKKSLKADVGYLVRLWGEIANRRETSEKAPALLYSELDLVLKTARDLFTDDVEKIVIDSREEYVRLRRFVEIFMPERASAIELYEGEEPIFDAYGIEDEIGRALSRKVPLNSGGHLIIDQAEALTAIDVNTGRFVGRGKRFLEETILQTNLEAVEEIAYQLRFRNIGGLIILDLIDMERISNREKVRRKLEQLLAKDKAKTTLNRISDLGLIEMTRKRTRESLGRIMNEPCFYCDGTGNLQSRQTIAYEILRQIKRDRMNLRGYVVVVNAHPAVVDFLKNEERAAVIEAERRYTRRIELVPRKEYHLEQFDLIGK